MKISNEHMYICPACGSGFELTNKTVSGNEVMSGTFVCANKHSFTITDGIPDFTWPKELGIMDDKQRMTYEKMANEYEKYASIPFRSCSSDEAAVRADMTARLNLREDSVVLEIGAGDGRGAECVAPHIGKNGRYFVQDLSPSFLKKSFERLEKYRDRIDFSIANGCYIPFPDNTFDVAYHFGGISTFSDVRACLKDLARVVKPGGKVMVGDESMAPWLRNTEFGRIMANSNPFYKFDIPFADIPVEARDVKVEWIMNGGFFLLEFNIGEGEPVGNYHIPIPSERGGTHWTRYYGNLEGVSDEVKKMAQKAREKSGKSMYDWLEAAIKEAAKKDL